MPQPAQRTLDGLADVLRPAVDAGDRRLLIEAEAELGRDDHVVARAAPAARSARATSSSFRNGPYDLGRVEEGDPELDGAMDGGDRLALVALVGRP